MQHILWNTQIYTPSKIVCVGRNYVKHIEELKNAVPEELVLFLKPNSAISGDLICPLERCRFETEITLLIENRQPVAVGLGLDLTLVDVQSRLKEHRLPWEKAKAFDASAVFSPFVDIPDPIDDLWFQLQINSVVRQQGGVAEMIHKPSQILAEIQPHFSLSDGDLVMTGTPHGVDDLVVGDVFQVSLWHGSRHILEYTWSVQKSRPCCE